MTSSDSAPEQGGTIPLKLLVCNGPSGVQTALTIASQTCAALGELHRRGVTHGGLAPESVLVDVERRRVELTGTGSASGAHVSRITSYTSPEQTGRMNRTVDYRTDFYSLGAICYELLAGVPPFSADDPLELVHAHIARMPMALGTVAPHVPAQVAAIVSRLMAKDAEDRYRSALGVQHDLDRCLEEWTTRGTVTTFDLGLTDVPQQFLIPQRLYGRDPELRELLHAFDETCAGGRMLMLVSGYSGIGKTSFIHELYRPIVRERAYFITGKFDQVVRDIPYGAVTQALRNLVAQLLTESEERLASWRRRLSAALGANGGVLAEVIPEIELIIGPQQAAPLLDPTEARNRFAYVFQSFVAALATDDHPLVVFLDDLQWVDLATMDLVQALLTHPDIHHLLILGAYRDNEVGAGHALSLGVGRLEAGGGRVSRLTLGPLGRDDLGALLVDALHRERAYVEPLAGLIRQKTDGNPFFVIQFLKMLDGEGLIAFDPAAAGWSFDMTAIAAATITENVVELMTRKIRRLSAVGQQVVTVAACIGSSFDRDILLGVSGLETDAALAGLQEALSAGLVQDAWEGPSRGRDGAAAFSFLHDRVQHAAYSLLPDAQKKPIHLEVGRRLLQDLHGRDTDERIFTTVNHLNLASDLIDDPRERLELARLNLSAGRKAKASAAYHAALACFERAASLPPASAWTTEFDIMFASHLELAEARYLTGAFAPAEEALRDLLSRAGTPVDRAHVHGLRITLFENQSRWQEAVEAGREGLRHLGIALPEGTDAKRAALDAEVRAVEDLVRSRPIASLVEAPEMTDPAMRIVMRILTTLWAPAYISGDEPLARLISATMVRLSILHGQTEDSAYGYVTHAITVGPVRKDYRAAYEWGVLALQVNRRFDDVKRRAKIHQQFQAHVNLWTRPFQTCIEHAREATRAGLEAGDFTYAGYGAATEAWSAFLVARDLAQFVRDYTPTLAVLERVKLPDFAGAHRVLLNWARALQGRTLRRLSLSDDTFDERHFIAEHREQAPFFLTFVYTARLHMSVLMEDTAAANEAAAQARAVVVSGTIWPVLVSFWGGLAAAAACDGANEAEQAQYRHRVQSAARELDELGLACPENFRVMALLLASEARRLNGLADEASSIASEALAYARQTANLPLGAVAGELCGRLSLQRGETRAAGRFLSEARRDYATWGADIKVAQLDARYGDLFWPDETRPDRMLRAQPDRAGASIDMATVLKVAHAIAVEIEAGALVRTLLSLAIENAGAERGLFIQEQRGALVVEAEADTSGRVIAGAAVPIDRADGLAVSIVRYVQRTGQDVVVGDAARDERFSADVYLARRRTRSVLCVPVAHQGRMRGILYLENNLTADAFTPDRLEIMRVLAAQAAISLENARLYDSMRDEVARRTSAELALREALDEVQALKNRLEAENVYLQEEIRTQHNFNEIIGNSPSLLEALHKVERVAPTDSTVLIVGETGSGKELFARAVHSRSRRRDRPLVKVNCGAIAPGLVESELFGHVKGAFTGAIEKRVGRFELATGGTIFLDEIGELPLDAQVKLLRVLQEQEFEPVGSSRTVRVNVRVIAATNRDLDTAVREGRFRADLLYRLNVFPIGVPALRERPADIPLLTGFFASSLARRLGKPLQGFSGRSMDRLVRYAWPGNVRELQNIVERAAILAQGPVMDLEGTVLAEADASAPAPSSDRPSRMAAGDTLEEVQRDHILSVLETTRGVVEGSRGAATILGMHPNTLRSRMKKLGITPARRGS